MTLSYRKASPQDMLAKAERDLARLEAAESAQDDVAMSDAIIDFAVALTSVKDWLKVHPGASFTPAHVEKYVAGSTALNAFRDIANSGKHRIIRDYVPQTISVAGSNMISVVVAIPDNASESRESPKPFYRLKIIRGDGSRYRAVELGSSAVREWRTFMKSHGLTA